MAEEITGTGAANDAMVVTESDVASLDSVLGEAEVKAADLAEAQRVVAADKAKIEKLKGHVTAAEAVLARDEADLAALLDN